MHAVKRLLNEINGPNDKEAISSLEQEISDNIEKVLQDQSFFTLPLTNILSIVEKMDLSEPADSISNIEKLIKGVIAANPNNDETLFLLKKFNLDESNCSLNDIITILKSFSNVPICVKLGELYLENNQLPDKDYDYELKLKDNEIRMLRARSVVSADRFDSITDVSTECEKGNLDNLKYLVDKGANLETSNSEGLLPIHIACRYGHFQIVQYLKDKGVNMEAKDSLERTPLHIACEYGFLPIVEYLIEVAGVKQDSRGRNGVTPFIVAYIHHRHSIVEYYKKKFPIPELPEAFEPDINIAAQEGYLQSVQFLIEKIGISNEARDWQNSTPLHSACIGGNLSIVSYLVEKQNVNIEAVDNEGKTPLHKASENGKLQIVKYLLSKGANKNARSYANKTPADIACETSNATVIKKDILQLLQ